MSAFKKILFGLALLVISSPAYADIIALNTISADATAAGIDGNFVTVKNVVNGQIQGSATTGSSTNILADSIGELDMGDEVNPRVRDSELLGVTVDTTTTQAAFVYTGLTPATSATLVSNISAGTAYINGYRVVKTATSKTYTASKDTYVDLSQTGSFTYSEVANGAAAPTVAANSARLAKVVTSGTAITSVTDLANRRIPGLAVPTNFRSGCSISRDSTTTITVMPGSYEVNGTILTKTSTTTLTISTAGDWAGGSSLRAADTYAYVGSDSSGNLKMHTTAPTNDNYALTTTSGKKRYASWSSTTYRALGWFYMDGAQLVEVASNIKEGDVANCIISTDSALQTIATTSSNRMSRVRFYSSGGPVITHFNSDFTGNGGADRIEYSLSIDNVTVAGSRRLAKIEAASADEMPIVTLGRTVTSQSSHTVEAYGSEHPTTASDLIIGDRSLLVEEQ